MYIITNYGFVIDNRRCIGCHSCTVACKTEHDDALGANKTWVKYVEKGAYPDTSRQFSVLRCNHCNESPCTEICPVNALFEREDGIVDFDPERCIGCKSCMQACPYDSIHIDPDTETAAKCNYCSHRIDSGRQPACVTACPEDAIVAGDIEDPESEISQVMSEHDLQARKPEKGTDPSLFYVNGDDANLVPGSTARNEHYLWSDAPSRVETHARAREEFDLDDAAESLADSEVSADPVVPDTGSSNVASDGGQPRTADVPDRSTESTTTTADRPADEFLQRDTERIYDVGEDHTETWGWQVYAYTWTKSIAAGAVLVPALLMLAGLFAPGSLIGVPADPQLLGVSALIATGFLGLTGALLIVKLNKLRRFHWVLLRPNWSSWLVKGAYVISGFGALLGAVVVGWLAGVRAIVHPIVLGALIIGGTATAVYTALLLGQAKGRDLWQSPLLPVHLFAQAILAGAAVAAGLGVLGFTDLLTPARVLLGGGLIVHLGLIGAEFAPGHQTEDAHRAAQRILRGRFRGPFWASVIAGGVVPLAMVTLAPTAGVVAGAGGLALAGLLAYEYSLIIAPQTLSMA